MCIRYIFSLLTLILLVPATRANSFKSIRLENWHQWRGPEANGLAPHGDPPTRWDESTNIRWKVEIPGTGSATPIVWQDRIYILTAIDMGTETDSGREPAAAARLEGSESAQSANPPGVGRPPRGLDRGADRRARPFGRGGMTRRVTTVHQFVILCLDKATGKERWRRIANEAVPHEGGHRTNSFASASPATDGQFLYASFGSRGIYCYDLDGNFIWKRDLGAMRTRAGFGEGASPALHEGSLIVNWDHEGDSFITCLDTKTGSDRWRVDRDEVTTWATPLIVEHGDITQIVTNGTNRSRAYDIEDGRLIWECGGQVTNPIASPVTTQGLAFCMTGHRGYALYAIPLNAKGDITGTDSVAWSRNRGTPYIASPLLYDGLLYFTKSRNGILSCVEASTGKEIYTEKRLPGIDILYASLAGAAGKVYATGRDGTTVVVQHGPEFEVLATNQLDEGIDASPVIVGDCLFLRGSQHLYCISEK